MSKQKIFFVLNVVAALILVLSAIGIATINIFAYRLNAPDNVLYEYFGNRATDITIHRKSYQGTEIRYIESGIREDWAPLVLFIHGAPGTLDAFKEYMADYDLKNKARLVAIDRPGYGGSSRGNTMTSITEQAQYLTFVLNQFNAPLKIIVSHSYGSPISVVSAANNPDGVDGLIMISPLNDADSEPVKWYAHLANFKLTRLLMPEFINVATTEKLAHKKELKTIEPYFSDLECPVIHYHGTDDRLAPYKPNIEFSKVNIKPINLTIIEESDAGHLLVWTKGATIKNMILGLINTLSD